jgi:hypothetical protein
MPTLTSTFTVEPNGTAGFYVVEHTVDGYAIPRGWTYPTRQLADDALPLVREGNHYPKVDEILAANIARNSRARGDVQ